MMEKLKIIIKMDDIKPVSKNKKNIKQKKLSKLEKSNYKLSNGGSKIMGMAASQARYLSLTARKNNTEYAGQQINQQRTTLSNESANYNSELLGLSVPTSPSVDSFTKVTYTWKGVDGVANTINSITPKADTADGNNYYISYNYADTVAEAYYDTQTIDSTTAPVTSTIKRNQTYTPGTLNTATIGGEATTLTPVTGQNQIYTYNGDDTNGATGWTYTNSSTNPLAFTSTKTLANSAGTGNTLYNTVKGNLPTTTTTTPVPVNIGGTNYNVSFDGTNYTANDGKFSYSLTDDTNNKTISLTQAQTSGPVATTSTLTANTPTYTYGKNNTPLVKLNANSSDDAEKAKLLTLQTQYLAAHKNDKPAPTVDANGKYQGNFYSYTDPDDKAAAVQYFAEDDINKATAWTNISNDVTDVNKDGVHDNQQAQITKWEIGNNTKTETENNVGVYIDRDTNGQMTAIKVNDHTYSLTTTTSTDQNGYNDAMSKYEYGKATYDKKIDDIDAKISIIQTQDRSLEVKLKQLDTEQEAISTEMDAVKKVIDKNIESSFKTFA